MTPDHTALPASTSSTKTVLILPDSPVSPLSIRAKALVFHDPGSHELLRHVERIARSDATVLVHGETGTGKELIARHIHATSGRSGPFVAVNCGAFSETLIDAELFGHEAGAFTGASQARAGWFEAANGGTLFLDEIGDLPLSLQVKLLRVLQERQVVRLGSRRGVALDVRLVAATNIDLKRAVEARHFRADLYYRLGVARVQLPPLRQRPADILPLARHFISVYRSRLEMQDATLSDASQAALLAYSWPGNIRELENVIHFALIVCRDQVIHPADLQLVPLSPSPESPQGAADSDTQSAGWPVVYNAASPGQGLAVPTAPLPAPAEVPPIERLALAWRDLLSAGEPELFDTVEGVLIHTAYEHCHHNQVRTARRLGITRNMLRTQLKRHGLLAGDDDRSADLTSASRPPAADPAVLHSEG
ncbi:MAG: sigma-54-dependent Fis family transcriptional regulator [Rubrivivax sp.]|nr:MAG: sigma-54-dependent Fis family transcriptional regulator [Rubrivivax sp.]